MGHIHEQNRSSRDWAGGAGGSFHLGRSLEQNGTPPLGVLQRMVWPEAPWREQVFMTGAGDFPLPVVWETLSPLTHTNTFGIVIIDHLRFFFYFKKCTKKKGFSSHKLCSLAFFHHRRRVRTSSIDREPQPGLERAVPWMLPMQRHFKAACHTLRLLFQGASLYAHGNGSTTWCDAVGRAAPALPPGQKHTDASELRGVP